MLRSFVRQANKFRSFPVQRCSSRISTNAFVSPAASLSPKFSAIQGSSIRAFSTGDEGYFSAYEDEEVQYPYNQTSIGELAPSFSGPAVIDGEITNISLDDYKGKWVVLFFYPKDFTFVCPTEIIAFSDRHKEFEKLNAQLIACSTDTEECHLAWTRVPRNQGGLGKMDIPLLADTKKIISSKYGVLLQNAGIALRGLFLINPQGVLEQITINNLPVGRSVDETIRLLQAFQFVEEHGEVCPANWKPGDKTMIPNSEDSQEYFASVNESATDDASNVASLQSKQEFDELIASGKPIVVDFMASWCGKCAQIMPHVEKLAEENPNITFVKVDTSNKEFDELKKNLDIQSLPAFRFYQHGKEVHEPVVGYKKRLLSDAVAAF